MLDFFHITATPGADIQYYVGGQTTAATGDRYIRWQTWRKPRGAKWIYMLAVGPGGGGGAGFSGATGGGGGGGPSGAQQIIMLPAMWVPEILYIQCGRGGIGAQTSASTSQSGGGGVTGGNTYVGIDTADGLPTNTMLIAAQSGGSSSATFPTATTGGAASLGPTSNSIASWVAGARGLYTSLNGQGGVAGGTNTAVGSDLLIPNTGLLVTGGAGGGGSNTTTGSNGGAVTGIASSPFAQSLIPILLGGPAPGGIGTAGIITNNQLMFLGGAGGAGGTSTVAPGRGGDGAPGCGGGGGGGGNGGAAAVGVGGNGGPGFVYIITLF
jgi:hypothetical protein